MTTIRALMLAQQARHTRGLVYRDVWPIPEDDPPHCLYCDNPWPCADRVAADAVIATLDAAEKTRRGWIDMGGFDEYRLVPDPGAS